MKRQNTLKGIHVSHVDFDREVFLKIVQKLVLFHKRYIIPELLKQ
jgi:hypothetical protein